MESIRKHPTCLPCSPLLLCSYPFAASVSDKILDDMDPHGGHFYAVRSKSWSAPWKHAQASAALTPKILLPPPKKLPYCKQRAVGATVLVTYSCHDLLFWQTWTCRETDTDFLTNSFTNKPLEVNQTKYWAFPIIEAAPFCGERTTRKQAWMWRWHPTRRSALCYKPLPTGIHMPASPGSFKVLDFTMKPYRTTLVTTSNKVFMAFVCMGWRQKQMKLKLWPVSRLRFPTAITRSEVLVYRRPAQSSRSISDTIFSYKGLFYGYSAPGPSAFFKIPFSKPSKRFLNILNSRLISISHTWENSSSSYLWHCFQQGSAMEGA